MLETEVRVEVCKSCNKLFHALTEKLICPNCKVEQADEFRQVKVYIRTHKYAGIEEVSRACEVTHRQILEWVREERLFFSDGAKVALPCLNCGEMIPMGKYCPVCLAELKNKLAPNKKEPEKRFKMKKQKNKNNYISPY